MARKNSIIPIVFYIGCVSFLLYMLRYFFVLYLKDVLFFSGFEVGLACAVMLFAGGSVVRWSRSDRDFCPKKFMGWGVFFMILFLLSVLFFDSGIFLWLSFFLGGLSVYIFQFTSRVFVLKNLHFEDHIQDFGGFMFVIFFMSGLGVALSGYIIEMWSFKTLLWWMIPALFGVSLFSKVLPATQTMNARIALAKVSLFANKRVLLFCTIFFLFAFHASADITSYALFLHETLGLSLSEVGYFIAGKEISLALTAYFLSMYVQKRKDMSICMYYGLMCTSLGTFGMVYSATTLVAFSFRLVYGIGEAAIILLIYAGVSSLLTNQKHMGYSKHIPMSMISGATCGSILFGWMGASWGYAYPFFVAACASFIGFLLYIFSRDSLSEF